MTTTTDNPGHTNDLAYCETARRMASHDTPLLTYLLPTARDAVQRYTQWADIAQLWLDLEPDARATPALGKLVEHLRAMAHSYADDVHAATAELAMRTEADRQLAEAENAAQAWENTAADTDQAWDCGHELPANW